jgi:hypothetical protein
VDDDCGGNAPIDEVLGDALFGTIVFDVNGVVVDHDVNKVASDSLVLVPAGLHQGIAIALFVKYCL